MSTSNPGNVVRAHRVAAVKAAIRGGLGPRVFSPAVDRGMEAEAQRLNEEAYIAGRISPAVEAACRDAGILK